MTTTMKNLAESVVQLPPKEKGHAMMNTKLTMVYWKSKKFWLGKLVERPEIMTQGRTVKELEQNIQDAYQMMGLEDVPEKYQVKEVLV